MHGVRIKLVTSEEEKPPFLFPRDRSVRWQRILSLIPHQDISDPSFSAHAVEGETLHPPAPLVFALSRGIRPLPCFHNIGDQGKHRLASTPFITFPLPSLSQDPLLHPLFPPLSSPLPFHPSQLMASEEEGPPSYSLSQGGSALPSCFHNIGDLEFQGAVGRVWVDMGTADMLALDILVNALTVLSSDHVGIKRLTIGGGGMEGWVEGRASGDEGYQLYSI